MKGKMMKRYLPPLCIVLLALTACVPAPTATSAPEQVTLTIYFQDMDMFAVGSEPYEVAVTRNVPATNDLPRAVLEQLFLGPTSEEQAENLRLVSSGTTGFSDLTVQAGIARVYLTGACNSSGSTYTIGNLIFANLSQFPEITAVKIYDQNGETETPDGPTSSIPFCLEP